jgi:hypothetical protein
MADVSWEPGFGVSEFLVKSGDFEKESSKLNSSQLWSVY